MTRLLRAGLFVLISVPAVGGCGLLPTDRPPKTSYPVNQWPDPKQPKWHRILFGTKWIAEGPPPPQLGSPPAPQSGSTFAEERDSTRPPSR